MKLLHLEKNCYPETSLKKLDQLFDVYFLETTDQETLKLALEVNTYEIIFTKLGLMLGAAELSLCPTLKYIVTPTTGHNHLDLDAAAQNGITVISLKGETEFLRTITSTAEHTWGLLLALVRQLRAASEDVESGFWRRNPFMGFDLYQKTVGIIGYGRLGQIIAKYAHAFGMQVLANDIDENVFVNAPDWVIPCNLDELLTQSEIVSLHIPFNAANTNFIDSAVFSKMKRQPYLINTSRGEVVDEQALLFALESGKITGAGLDVLHGDSAWGEKNPPGHALITYAQLHKNLLLTPHMGGYGDNSIFNTRAFITDKFLKDITI